MKNTVLTFALLLLPLVIFAQRELAPVKPDCDSLFRAGDSHLRRQNLQQALQCYLGAMNCDTRLAGKVGPKIEEVFGRMERQRRSEAAAKEDAEKRRMEAEELTRTTFANDLAYKSQIVLERGDRTTAFRLAEFAHRYVDGDNPNVLRALLEACYYNDHPDTLHRLPWNYNLEGHTEKVQDVAFSPDGRRLLTKSAYEIKIWNLESGKVAYTHTVENMVQDDIACVSFSPDGRPLAILTHVGDKKIWDLSGNRQSILDSEGGKVAKIWDVENGTVVQAVEGFEGNNALFSPDGRFLAATATGSGSLKIWDLDHGEAVQALKLDSFWVHCIAFSPDSRHIVTNSEPEPFNDEVGIIWDLENGRVTQRIKRNFDFGFSVLDFSFSPDGRWLAAAGTNNTTAMVWDLENGEVAQTLGDHTAPVRCVLFSPDGRHLAAGTEDGVVKLWNWENGKAVQTLKGHAVGVGCIAFSPDGRWLASGSDDGSIKIWDLEPTSAAQTLKFDDLQSTSISFSPDGRHMAAALADGSAQIRDLENGKVFQPLDSHVEEEGGISFSPDWRRLATWSANTVKIWDWESGSIMLTLMLDSFYVRGRGVAFSPDGYFFSTRHLDSIKIWNLKSGMAIQTLGGNGPVSFSPDGRHLAAVTFIGDTKILDLTNGEVVFTLRENTVNPSSVSFSPDGRRLAMGSEDGSATIWNVENGKPAHTLKGHTREVSGISFSPDGRLLATGSKDGSVKIWEVESGAIMFTLEGSIAYIENVSFSPDGSRLAAAGGPNSSVSFWDLTPDGLVNIWDLTPDALIKRTKVVFADSVENTVARGERRLATLTARQLQDFGLGKILDLNGSGAMNNEAKLIAAGEAQQMVAFADLYAQKARHGQGLNHAAADYARAARLYRAAFENGGDSTMMYRLGELYGQWADDILSGSRPDTALRYIGSAFQWNPDERRHLELQLSYAAKTGRRLDFKPKNADLLWRLGYYFSEKENWNKAAQLLEESEALEHNQYKMVQLYEIGAKTALGFDFQRFLASPFAGELRYYAHYFYGKGKWQEARQLYEKAEQIEHHPDILIRLCQASEMAGQSFDFQRFLSANAPEELTQYAAYFLEKADTLLNYRDRIPDYQSALRLREKQLTLDTTTATRIEVANVYNSLAFYQLFLPDGAAAEASLRRAFELDPTNKFIPTNRAPALLLQGRWAEAEAEYLKWKDLEYGENGLATCREAFLSDIDELEKQGVTHPDFARARALLDEN